uniref:Uncharacterized protein n=1 Tax=blood disease bacterium R229 TaxID=741978 RepID=G2ZPV2_9RALS|nr:exported hypothetical protein [blood disease bacterium R229]
MRLRRRTTTTLSQPVGAGSAKALQNGSAFASAPTTAFNTNQPNGFGQHGLISPKQGAPGDSAHCESRANPGAKLIKT